MNLVPFCSWKLASTDRIRVHLNNENGRCNYRYSWENKNNLEKCLKLKAPRAQHAEAHLESRSSQHLVGLDEVIDGSADSGEIELVT